MIPNNYQNALCEDLSNEALSEMQSAIRENLFYGVATPTLCGGLTLGLIEAEELDIPCLFATKEEAGESFDDELERYNEEVAAGERDEEDKPDGFVCAVRWNDDGQHIDIYSECLTTLLETKEPKAAAGG